jgi:hypothetical protein
MAVKPGVFFLAEAGKKKWPIRVFTLNIDTQTGKIQPSSYMNMR